MVFTHDPAVAKLAGPLVGPVVAVFTFICSVGNIPLAAVLWNAGAIGTEVGHDNVASKLIVGSA